MKQLVDGQFVEVEPLSSPPGDFSFAIENHWLPAIDFGSDFFHPRHRNLVAYLEEEAIEALTTAIPGLPRRPVRDTATPRTSKPAKAEPSKFAQMRPPSQPDTEEAAHARWLDLWVRVAHEKWDRRYDMAPRQRAAITILVRASELRYAIQAGQAEKAAALGMLIAFEAVSGGYSVQLEADAAAKKVLERSRREAFEAGAGRKIPDYELAAKGCVGVATKAWAADPQERISAVVDECFDWLSDNLAKFPSITAMPIPGTIKNWLIEAEKAGGVVIPPAARRPGANKRKAKGAK